MKPIIALLGENEVEKKRELAKRIKAVSKDDLSIYYGDELKNDDKFALLKSQCMQSSLFGKDNVIIVKGANKLFGERVSKKSGNKFEEFLGDYIKNPPDDTTLILMEDNAGAETEKKKSKISSDVIKSIKTIGEVIETKPPNEREILEYARKRLKDEGRQFDPTIPDFLLQLAGKDIEQIEKMLDILLLYAKNGKTIDTTDARALFSGSHNMRLYDLIDGIFGKNLRKALSSLNDLKLSGEEILTINYRILSYAKDLWKYIATKSTESGGKNYYLSQYARRIDLKFLSAVIDTVARIEMKAKSMPTDFAFLELESFILTALATR